MSELTQLALFTAKLFIILIFIAALFSVLLLILVKAKGKSRGKLKIKNLNKQYSEMEEALLHESLDKKALKHYYKEKKDKEKHDAEKRNIYVINFHGDIKASAVDSLSQEINAILTIATPKDEVVVRLDSTGGVVYGYGLAASELIRIRNQNISLTIIIDKVAASGGYLMAAVANKIIAAPFAIIGSIGVVVQLPNFHRFLKDKHIDFEQHTAGEFKRTITLFGENTEEGRQKLQEDIENIHQSFKDLITEYRKKIDIDKVATGEYWLASQALKLNLVDELGTSDDYLFKLRDTSNLFEVCYEVKKPFLQRLSASGNILKRFFS